MNTKTIAIIRGDGIGPEVVDATLTVLDGLSLPFRYEYVTVGLEALERSGDPLPPEAVAALKNADVVLKGPTATPAGGGHRSVNVRIREELETYANVRPARSLLGVPTPFPDVDLVIIRENLEDLYAGIEFPADAGASAAIRDLVRARLRRKVAPDAAISLKIISTRRSTEIAEFGLTYAARYGIKRVTVVHKANILKVTDGLFLTCFREAVARLGANLTCDDMIVDNCAHQLVTRPQRFGVLVCPNLYGDILSDLTAGLVGGLGIAPGANIGRHHAVFEAVHGTAPDIAGKGLANPTALLRSAALMLRHLEAIEAAERLERAIATVIVEKRCVTQDLHPEGAGATTLGMAAAIRERLT